MKTQDISESIVRIGGGRGFVVGKSVITASHCLELEEYGIGNLYLADAQGIEIETFDGRKLRLEIRAIDFASDIAVLGASDPQESPEDFEAFHDFRKGRSLRIETDAKVRLSEPIRIQNPNGVWIHGRGTHQKWSPRIFTEMDGEVLGGSSGGPILAHSGEVVGVVSNTGNVGEGSVGSSPRPSTTLPLWILKSGILRK